MRPMMSVDMPMYDFQSVQDPAETIELYFSMKDAPSLGEVIEHEGGSWRRTIAADNNAGQINNTYPYESLSLMDGFPGCKPGPNGGNMVMSKRHEQNILAQARANGHRYERI